MKSGAWTIFFTRIIAAKSFVTKRSIVKRLLQSRFHLMALKLIVTCILCCSWYSLQATRKLINE